ncbi:MAG TPA: phosphate acyltransferase PlsX [Clostridiales bacterium]|nr:phosphate acyltransferase PlsX [Clostridiales bacterium]
MRIVIDAMGGDHAPVAIVKGAVDAARKITDELILVGDEKRVREELSKYIYDKKQIRIVHAGEVIGNDEAPVRAVRSKPNSSMVVGLSMVKEKQADLFVSAGNTGAIMAGALFLLGRIQGIDRPAIAATYPILKGGVALLVDSGANVECKPNNLLEFAVMGSIYMEKVLNIKNPRVGLINIGTEESKGTAVLKAAYPMLERSHVNFVGNVEARELPNGVCDVMVCDGFTGNIILKLTEGLAWSILKLIKNKFTESTISKMGALLLSGKLKGLKRDFDYTEYGGAPILGVRGAVLKMHGSSDAKAVCNTIVKGAAFADAGVVQIIEGSVVELEDIQISE